MHVYKYLYIKVHFAGLKALLCNLYYTEYKRKILCFILRLVETDKMLGIYLKYLPLNYRGCPVFSPKIDYLKLLIIPSWSLFIILTNTHMFSWIQFSNLSEGCPVLGHCGAEFCKLFADNSFNSQQIFI